MCNFKVGQKVVRLLDSHSRMKVGDVAVVKSVSEDGIRLVEFDGVHDDSKFALYVEPGKKVTIDVCHRLVAYNCELGSLQAQLDNLHENYQNQVDQLEDTISKLVTEMTELKSEYNVE